MQHSKALITMGILIFSTIGGWIGELIGGGWFGLPSLILGTLGCFIGIWVGYKVGNYL